MTIHTFVNIAMFTLFALYGVHTLYGMLCHARMQAEACIERGGEEDGIVV